MDIEQLKEALEIGLDAARDVAAETHAKYAGYKPERHRAVEEDVRKIEDAIADLAAAPQAQDDAKPWSMRDARLATERFVCGASDAPQAQEPSAAPGDAQQPRKIVAVRADEAGWYLLTLACGEQVRAHYPDSQPLLWDVYQDAAAPGVPREAQEALETAGAAENGRSAALPELPEPAWVFIDAARDNARVNNYSADQMREYARAALVAAPQADCPVPVRSDADREMFAKFSDPEFSVDAVHAKFAAPQAQEPIYQVQYVEESGTSAWHDATEDAYHTFMPERRRIVYAVPQAQEPAEMKLFGYFHELLNHEGKGNGVWLGVYKREVLEQAHTEGETGKEIVTLYRKA